ncbi:GSCOCG00007563001-RA-CDS [Cotesia congregata]|uniref:Deoxyribodipyrimidine photo-lyase n=1 Tax=Cotesia congregata TaxID=51543 RepID=A0A8J2HLB1_COTCN|nr:GSCOCG00007563001-RA-CDS [Cotesia congregata]CAG5101631.1 Similar to PHR: Deoxyribodipyrimidine photo-lyase (Potorous tridactylus) [Cotesia congregata]
MSEPQKKKLKSSSLFDKFNDNRQNAASSILDFKFNKNRVEVLSSVDAVAKNSKGILYWMFRDGRVQDNWSFLFAQKLALKNRLPLHVCYCILPKFLDATLRHYKFLIESLEEVSNDCKDLNINFHLLHGVPNVVVLDLIKKHKMGALVVDFFPLRVPLGWVENLKNSIPKDVPLCQVDAHNIVPCKVASDKLEYGARTIRSKINTKLPEYLTEYPPLIKHPHDSLFEIPTIDWKNALKDVEIDLTVDKVDWCKPGYRGALAELESFIKNRLPHYNTKRNDPTQDALSKLSPWFHFGQISVQRVILEVKEYKKKYKESVENFMEESIIRRELSDNFCFHNKNYDKVEGTNAWAIESLNQHRKDKREYLYTRDELEKSQTHDDLWNAAQNQMVREGKMHGFLRMYWAKKILEWTPSPEDALAWSIYLNDKYSMDGRDPNGYVGCMWSICGIHDQGWKERSVFGKIRYMNYKGCERKFDVKAFVRKYDGKIVNKKNDISKIFKKK